MKKRRINTDRTQDTRKLLPENRIYQLPDESSRAVHKLGDFGYRQRDLGLEINEPDL